MKWLVALGSLMFAAGCGPMDSDQPLDPAPSSDMQAEEAPGTDDSHAAAVTCPQKCQNQRNKCIAECSPTSSACMQGCRNRYEICILNC
ncbi:MULTISPECIES: hypothetical protein [unclassified Corallococcus]|uniref:hypothetical protein n=1 Tax=unclassified Corallococcus TaxID=2685029 RepID=UPI001A8D2CC2|nr:MULTISPECIES: hypothetical protein [unclassified Corallococcus]MBN9684724.1 hypothetical protein [Corallococcus sp. NCSPR001]WAS83806.1 hypothetical protein O0N60_31440 [Corallococcus sp. NCRR]